MILAGSSLTAQAQGFRNRPFARASGEGSVSVRPDQIKVSVGVITQGNTAQEASEANAAQMSVVLEKLRGLLGQGADIRTTAYSVTPNYRYPTGGGVPILTGYTASNTVEVTSGDLSAGGRIIDTAAQAGANSVTGIRFSLKDPSPVRTQALRQATASAKLHAEAIAGGLGMKLGSIISAEESSAVRPVYTDSRLATGASAATTPVETGMVEVHAYVVVEGELIP